MANLKEVTFDSLIMPEIPETLTIFIEDMAFELIPDYVVEEKSGVAPGCFDPHKHLAHELIIIKEGKLSFYVSGETLNLFAGDYILIPANIEHRLISVSENLQKFRLRFMPSTEISTSLSAPYIKDQFSDKKSELIFSLIDDLRESGTVSSRHRCYELAIILKPVVEKLYGVIPPASVSHSAQAGLRTKIENYMYLNYSRPITLELLAENLSYSRTQMRRIIEDCFGMPFTEKLREIRLGAAKKHLADGKMPIEEIAEACGYETRQGFEAMFLKYVGKTPNQYRRRYNR